MKIYLVIKRTQNWFKLAGLVAMITLLPTIGDYLINSWQVSAQELIIPVLLDLTLAAIVASCFYRVWKRDRLAGLIGALLTAALLSNGYDARYIAFQPLLSAAWPLPQLGDAVLSAVLIGAFAAGSYWLGRAASWLVRRQKWNAKTLTGALAIAVSVTFALQFIPAATDLASAWPQFFYHPPKLAAAPAGAKVASKPDIYYIILEDYANPETLKTSYNYDDSQFTDFLTSQGYYINPNNHANYPYTNMNVASTLQLNYDAAIVGRFAGAKVQTIIPYNQAIRSAPAVQALKSLGYQYDLIANWYEPFSQSSLADQTYQDQGMLKIGGSTMLLDNFQKDELAESVFWRFLVGSPGPISYSNANQVPMTLRQLDNLKALAKAPAGGRFIMSDILVPHEPPYYFNADGSLNTNYNGDSVGEPIKEKYTNEVTYINSQMETILSEINQISHGQAVVILQSDEGPYPTDLDNSDEGTAPDDDDLLNQSMLNWSLSDIQTKYATLAAYHVPAASPSALSAGGNNVNAFRLVFNSYFGYQLPYLSQCYYAYPNGRGLSFDYANINQQITGQASTTCTANGSGPK